MSDHNRVKHLLQYAKIMQYKPDLICVSSLSSCVQFVSLPSLVFLICLLFIQVGVQTAVWQGSGLPRCQSHAFLHCLQHPPVQLWVPPELQGWHKSPHHTFSGLMQQQHSNMELTWSLFLIFVSRTFRTHRWSSTFHWLGMRMWLWSPGRPHPGHCLATWPSVLTRSSFTSRSKVRDELHTTY